jgi:hypothetical protein
LGQIYKIRPAAGNFDLESGLKLGLEAAKKTKAEAAKLLKKICGK